MLKSPSYTPAELNAKMQAHYRSGDLAATTRNGVTMMNPYHFRRSDDEIEHKKLTARLMDQLYASLPEDHATLAQKLGKENDKAGPYMVWEAFATGHRNIHEGLQTFLTSAGPDRWNDAVNDYQTSKTEEVLTAEPERMKGMADTWLTEFPHDGPQLAFKAASRGNEQLLQHLLAQDIELHPEHDPSLQPLHAASHHGRLNTSQVILDAGVDVNIRDEFGGTPLMRAAVGGQTEMVRWLIEKGADPHVRETRHGNYNALEYGGGHVEIVRLLLDHGVQWSAAAMAAAASSGADAAFALLVVNAGFSVTFPLIKGALPDEQQALDDRQREAVLLALTHCAETDTASLDIARWLLRQCAKPSQDKSFELDTSDKELMSTLQEAVIRSTEAKATLTGLLLDALPVELVEQDAYVQDRPGSKYESFIDDFLIEAVAANALETARLLISKYNASVNRPATQRNATPLFVAAQKGHADMLRYLIEECKADIHIGSGKDANGPTPLWIAIRNQHEDAVRILSQAGGPFEKLHQAVEGGLKRLYVSAAKGGEYRSPVSILAWADPSWDEDGNEVRFLCLEFPGGFQGDLISRKSDEDLRDWRPLGKALEAPTTGLMSRLRAWSPWP